jgi:glutathione S-transferase
VRKVLAICEIKGVPYRIDPIVPFFGDERFSQLNPLRRIPIFIDEEVSVSDSTVIAEYLEERYASPALLPTSPADRARARWIEEFADTRLADVCIWRIFYEAVINPSSGSAPGTRTRSHARWPRTCLPSWRTWSGWRLPTASCSGRRRLPISLSR